MFYAIRDSMRQFTETRARCGFQAYLQSPGCTISWHGPVNGMHSIENRCTYKRAIFIDAKNRRSKKILVLWQLLKFFRLVRRPGLKPSHCWDRKISTEGGQGSIAKRWSRRTEKKCWRQD